MTTRYEYCLIAGQGSGALGAIQESLNRGWEPVGPVQISADKYCNNYCATLRRPKEATDEQRQG